MIEEGAAVYGLSGGGRAAKDVDVANGLAGFIDHVEDIRCIEGIGELSH